MRRFTLGSGTDRKIVVIEVNGTRMSVVQMMPDRSTKRSERDFGSEAEARSASDQVARELISRGYAEAAARGAKPASTGTAASKPAAKAREHEAAAPSHAFDDLDAPPAAAAPVLPRLDSAPGVKSAPDDAPQKKKKKSGKKKKKKAQSGDALDKRVLAGVGAVVVAFIGVIGFIVYDIFIKPPTIVGVWRGGMVEHEISRSLTLAQYDLVLDDKSRASLALQGPGEESAATMVGTYAVKGNRLKLALKDEDGTPSDREFKIVLGRVTLELWDPESGKLLVQLLRFRETPVVRPLAPRRSKPAEPAESDAETVDGSDE
jgi:hypothetical protein